MDSSVDTTINPMFVVNFSNNVILRYNLDTSVLAVNNWMEEIIKYDTSDLCDIHHKVCPSSKELITTKVNKLYELADILNSVYSGSIVKEDFFKGNENEILNRMHVHFPIIKNKSYMGVDINYYASRYNALIHSLETDFILKEERTLFNIALDVHPSPKGYVTHMLNVEDYTKFQIFNPFGSLILGYPHVGRTAQELFSAKDFTCPKEQHVPQTKVSASCRMVFGSFHSFMPEEHIKKHQDAYLTQWREFYRARGGKDFFGFDIDDPRLGFGSLRIGMLSCAKIGQEVVNLHSLNDALKLRKILLINEIVSFGLER